MEFLLITVLCAYLLFYQLEKLSSLSDLSHSFILTTIFIPILVPRQTLQYLYQDEVQHCSRSHYRPLHGSQCRGMEPARRCTCSH